MKARLAAFFVHFCASALVISLFSLLVFFIWYPYPYYKLQDTIEIALVLAGVDVVLGPVITFIIYNIRKPVAELTRDISLVVIIQLGALLWGASLIYSMRPVFVVYIDGTFHTTTLKTVELDKLTDNISVPNFFEGPKFIYVKNPYASKFELQQYFAGVFVQGDLDLQHRSELYKKITPFSKEVSENSLTHSSTKNNKGYMRIVDEFIGCNGGVIEDYLYYPLKREGVEYLLILKPEDIRYQE